MKDSVVLTAASLILVVLMTLHQADDIVRGFEPGGFRMLGGILMLVLYLCGTLVLGGRRSGSVIKILGALLAFVMCLAHLRGKGVSGAIARSGGGYFFIWTIYALGVIGLFSVILSVNELWTLRSKRQSMKGADGASTAMDA